VLAGLAKLVAAGVILNFVVAWGCRLVHGAAPGSVGTYRNPRDESPRSLVITRGIGYESAEPNWRHEKGEYPRSVRTYRGPPWWPSGREFWRDGTVAEASGWPLISLMAWSTSEARASDDRTHLVIRHQYHWAIVVRGDWFGRGPRRPGGPVLIPLLPLWVGTTGNVLFYAAVLWVPFRGAPAARAAVRRRRGLCARCAYPVGDGERCSECGTPVPARRASAG